MAKVGLKISKAFFDDHYERSEYPDSVEILHKTKKNYWISIVRNGAWFELYSDADYYSEPYGFTEGYFGLCMSAKALVKKMDSVYDDNWEAKKKFFDEHGYPAPLDAVLS